MLFGFMGQILHVNLTTREIEIERPDEEFYRHYLGGSLMGLYYLWRLTPPGSEPLSPENTMVFALSPTTGLPVSGQRSWPPACLGRPTWGSYQQGLLPIFTALPLEDV